MKPKELFFFLLVIFPAFISNAFADKIREPVWAGKFYPGSRIQLEKMIEELTQKVDPGQVRIPPGASLRALILPHAGYVYSGETAAYSSLVLSKGLFDKVILMGPDHRIGFKNGAVSDVTAYRTPLGMVHLHAAAAGLRRYSKLFRPVPDSDRQEHSLEVILPFLQTYIGDFELIPIVLGRPAHVHMIAEAVKSLLDSKTLLVASSDLSHFLGYQDAVAKDQKTIDMIINMEPDKLLRSPDCMCGKIPVLVMITIARQYGWKPVLLHYSNSGDTAGDRSRVVGYTAIAFWGELKMSETNNTGTIFSQEQGRVLIELARQTIRKKLGIRNSGAAPALFSRDLKDEVFDLQYGTFVTLKIGGNLRGCIGNLAASDTVVNGVKQNALNAAFHDPRFPALTSEELKEVEIEVSLLNVPRPLEYSDGEDLISKLRADVDGVILRKGYHSATFLPQVWEQLPKPEDFLSHLCMKAGLSADAWKNEKLDVSTYQVQYFEEDR